MAVGGLDYSIRKKVDPTFVKSMSQLADRVRHLERLRVEKVRHTKAKVKKEKVRHTEPIYEADYISPTEAEIDLAEMKPGPAYECKSLFRSNGKTLSVESTSKFPAKTYTFDVSKCEEIFDALVKDGQILIPVGAKIPPLKQRQKRGFCKYHNFLGHTTSQCVLFRDLVQKLLQEGRLKFTSRRMKIDSDPLRQEEALFTEVAEINVVDVENFSEDNMVEESEGESPLVKMADVYPKPEEELLDFLKRCKSQGSIVGLCPRYSALIDRQAVENFRLLQIARGRQ